jgi:hypothetical protein
VGQGNGFGAQRFGQRLRHGFCIAEIAHGIILCFEERKTSELALLTRSFGQREPEVARYIHLTPEGASSRLYPPVWKVR